MIKRTSTKSRQHSRHRAVLVPQDGRRASCGKFLEKHARAGIPDYWIVNPAAEQIIVMHLERGAYVERGIFPRGMEATSVLLDGFRVTVAAVLDAE